MDLHWIVGAEHQPIVADSLQRAVEGRHVAAVAGQVHVQLPEDLLERLNYPKLFPLPRGLVENRDLLRELDAQFGRRLEEAVDTTLHKRKDAAEVGEDELEIGVASV